MPTKKQARAAQKRRYERYEARFAARQRRRQRRQRVAGILAVGALALGGGALALTSMGPASSTPTPTASPPLFGPPLGYAEGREWTATISLDQGDLILSLDGAAAPQAVGSFVYLAQQGFFDETACHRLVDDDAHTTYVLQCGSPDGTSSGGPDYRFGPVENDPVDGFYPAGTVAMARVANGEYSMGSQFFIVYRDSHIASDAAGGYTIFASVADGLDIVEALAAAGTETGEPDGRPAEPVVFHEVTVS